MLLLLMYSNFDWFNTYVYCDEKINACFFTSVTELKIKTVEKVGKVKKMGKIGKG